MMIRRNNLLDTISFLDEFNNLPNYQTENQEQLRWNQEPFIPLENTKQYAEYKLLVGRAPTTPHEHAAMWRASVRAGVCAVVLTDNARLGMSTIDEDGEMVCDRVQTSTRFVSTAAYLRGHVCVTVDNSVAEDCSTWLFKAWPTSPAIVPNIPHFFIDFLRAIIANTWRACRMQKRPILILFRASPDVAALMASILLVLNQGCERLHGAFVFRCVSNMRRQFQFNVISDFVMYHFIYECLLMATCATPTILLKNRKEFESAYYKLYNRFRCDEQSGRISQPIVEQFRLIKNLTAIYGPKKYLTANEDEERLRKNIFQPRLYNNITYWKLFSFEYADHFIAIRKSANSIYELMKLTAKIGSHTILWFSDGALEPAAILAANGHARQSTQAVIRNVEAHHDGYYSFDLEAPIGNNGSQWRVKVFQFWGWPANQPKPTRSSRELLAAIRAALAHEQQLSNRPRITLYETTAEETATWRGAMAAIAAYLDQRMQLMGEIDVFRTAQMFKMFDRNAVVTTIDQYKWLFKVAWSTLMHWQQPEANETDNSNSPL